MIIDYRLQILYLAMFIFSSYFEFISSIEIFCLNYFYITLLIIRKSFQQLQQGRIIKFE